MPVKAPRALVTLVTHLVPSTCRDAVIGDLNERAGTSARFLVDAARVVPLVVWSCLRRRVSGGLLVAETLLLYAAFVSGAFYSLGTAAPAFFTDQYGLLRLAVPTLVATLALVLADTYELRLRVTLALGLAYVVNSVGGLIGAWAVPRGMMLWAVFVGLAFLPAVRCLFLPRRRYAGTRMEVSPDAADVRSLIAALERAIRVKTLVTSVEVLFLLAVFGWLAYRALNGLQLLGAGGIVAAMLYLLYQLYRYRARRAPAMSDEVSARFYEAEIERRQAFHAGPALWTRLAVIIPGYVIYLVGIVVAQPSALIRVALIAAVFFSLIVLAVPVNVSAARRYHSRDQYRGDAVLRDR